MKRRYSASTTTKILNSIHRKDVKFFFFFFFFVVVVEKRNVWKQPFGHSSLSFLSDWCNSSRSSRSRSSRSNSSSSSFAKALWRGPHSFHPVLPTQTLVSLEQISLSFLQAPFRAFDVSHISAGFFLLLLLLLARREEVKKFNVFIKNMLGKCH